MQQKKEWIPHEYQESAIRLMLKQGSVGLFLDPGLGKTSVCLAAFKILKAKGMVERMLIIAPLRPMKGVWPAEIQKWANFNELTYVLLHGPVKEEALNVKADIYIINPEGVKWLFNQPKLPEFDVLCIDESTKFKDSSTQRFKTIRPYIPRFKRRWILTGTPAPNGITDLFGQIYILDAGRALGKYVTHFREKYFYRGYTAYDWVLRPGAGELISGRIAPLTYRLKAEDYLKLPQLIITDIEVELPPAAREIYDEIEKEFMVAIEEDTIIAANAAVAGGKCRQIANGAVYNEAGEVRVVHEAKLDALADLIEELGGKPVYVVYEYHHDRDRILAKIPSAVLLPDPTKAQKLETVLKDFNAGNIPVLVGPPVAGLNLQEACHHVIWFSLTWNLEHYDQTIRRFYRQGQEADKVFVYHIMAKDTKDQDVAEVLREKDHTQQSLMISLASYRRGNIK